MTLDDLAASIAANHGTEVVQFRSVRFLASHKVHFHFELKEGGLDIWFDLIHLTYTYEIAEDHVLLHRLPPTEFFNVTDHTLGTDTSDRRHSD